MASAPFSTAALAQSQLPAGARSSGLVGVGAISEISVGVSAEEVALTELEGDKDLETTIRRAARGRAGKLLKKDAINPPYSTSV